MKIAYGKRWAINSMKRKFCIHEQMKLNKYLIKEEEEGKLVNRTFIRLHSNDMQDTVVNIR